MLDRRHLAGSRAGSRRSCAIEQEQQLQLAFAGAAADDRGREIARAADQVTIALLQGDDRPAEIGENLPILDAFGIEAAARCGLITGIEWCTRGDAAGLAIEPGEAPGLAAEPADILIGIAPAGEFPIENAGQLRTIQQVIAG